MEIVIIGAGPSGLMCAIKCSENKNNNVVILDGNEKIGKKLFITGKGRCNICNNTSIEGFLGNVVNNSKFLYTAINKFSPQDVINFFETNGTPLKIERGNRVFPVSDKSSDIIKTFSKLIKKNNITLNLQTLVKSIKKADNKFEVITNNKTFLCDAVVIATGGKSYSSTGSKGDGYTFAKNFGHTVIPPKPALVPLKLNNYNGNLAGLTLKNVSATIEVDGKKYSKFGEMLFTHTGVSGPIILTLSSLINRSNIKNANLTLDLKPNLTPEVLNNRLIRDFEQFKTKILKNYLKELLPTSLIDEFIEKNKFDANIPVCNIKKEDRQKIVNSLKCFTYSVNSLDDIEYAIVTSGGVSVKEVNPKTMQSKLVNNLFFVGEVLDLDALTGGYNIQIALSTGFAAGEYLAEF